MLSKVSSFLLFFSCLFFFKFSSSNLKHNTLEGKVKKHQILVKSKRLLGEGEITHRRWLAIEATGEIQKHLGPGTESCMSIIVVVTLMSRSWCFTE